jgi:hypothetical protein
MPALDYKPGLASLPKTDLPTPDPRRELVGRVLASSTFAKSERLSSMLLYICELALQGQQKDLSEQKIGEAVFSRSPNYDSAIDGIVRTHASRLRKKLDFYFDGEGAKEQMRIVLPRGGYIPLFEPRTFVEIALLASESDPGVTALPATSLSSNPTAANLEAADGAARHSLSMPLAWSLVIILAIGMLAMFLHDRRELATVRRVQAPDRSLSLPIFSPEVPTLIVPSDCGLVISEASLNRDVGLAEYLRGDYLRAESKTETTPEKLAGELRRRRYTSIVDLEAVQSLSQIARYEQSKFEVRFARDVRPNDFKQGNVILLGAAQGNPWVELFEHNMNFVISKNWQTGNFSVLNRFPQSNEARQWESSYDGERPRVYGIVAFLPNLSGAGNALLLEGTSMAGTECAWDFVSDNSQLAPFLERIRRSNGTIPHFEVLLETNNMSGSALKGNILAWRVVREQTR